MLDLSGHQLTFKVPITSYTSFCCVLNEDTAYVYMPLDALYNVVSFVVALFSVF